jgi:cellulose synthase/poly-beta-1,6-N-acetylglucosamine synthase-like glycosyltransferase
MNHGRERPFVSVVVPALNCADDVEGFAACMRAQTYPADSFEVIIVDNGSTDGTYERAQRVGLQAALQPARGRARALNAGIRQARGVYILTTDLSCRAAANWIESIVDTFDAFPSAACVAGEIKLLETGDNAALAFQRRTDYMSPFHALQRNNLPYMPFADGANASFRRSLFDEIGGFEDDFTKAADVEICYRILVLTRHTLVFNRHAVVWEPGEPDLKALLRQRFKMGLGTLLLQQKYPALFAAAAVDVTLKRRYWKAREQVCELARLTLLNVCALVGRRREEAQDASIRFLMSIAQRLGAAVGRRRIGRDVARPSPVAPAALDDFLAATWQLESRVVVAQIPRDPPPAAAFIAVSATA